MTARRGERAYKAGTRVRLDPLPTYHASLKGWNGRGTVSMDTPADAPLHLMTDGRRASEGARFVCGTSEVARLRDQTPNPEHEPPGGDWSPFWWLKINDKAE